jgi:hypothetical protein
MALPLLGYLETLPFATVERKHQSSKSAWQQAMDEGAVTLDEFIDDLRRHVNEQYDKLEKGNA